MFLEIFYGSRDMFNRQFDTRYIDKLFFSVSKLYERGFVVIARYPYNIFDTVSVQSRTVRYDNLIQFSDFQLMKKKRSGIFIIYRKKLKKCTVNDKKIVFLFRIHGSSNNRFRCSIHSVAESYIFTAVIFHFFGKRCKFTCTYRHYKRHFFP